MDFKIKLALLSCFLLIGSSLFAGDRDEIIEKDFDLGKNGTIRMDTNDGSITISTWDKNIVRVKAVKKVYGSSRERIEHALEDVRIRMDLRGNTLSIRVLERDNNGFGFFNSRRDRIRVEFDIIAPREVSLDISADESNVRVDGTKGDLEISTDEGEINLESIESNWVRLDADEGEISLDKVKVYDHGNELNAKIEVDEGNIKITNAEFTTLSLHADEGDIIIKETKVKDLVVWVDEGYITTELEPLEGSKIRMESDEGNVALFFPADYSVDYNLFADDGYIKTDFDLEFSDDRDDHARARGVLRDGKSKLRVRTDEGNIRFMRQ